MEREFRKKRFTDDTPVKFYHKLSVNERINLRGNVDRTTVFGDDDFCFMSVGGMFELFRASHSGYWPDLYRQYLPSHLYEYI